MGFEPLPEGWEVWTESEEKAVLVFRPDVFDGDALPAPCMPTVYVTKGKRRRKPGRDVRPGDPWYVTLFLEPEVSGDEREYPDREAAVAVEKDMVKVALCEDHFQERLEELSDSGWLDELRGELDIDR